MLIDIDFSLFGDASAVGRVYGALNFDVLPRVGETIMLSKIVQAGAGFNGSLIVEHVIHTPNEPAKPLLALSALVVSSEDDARLLGTEFESRYGLFFDEHEK
jgi:hypothetical protein